MHILYSFQFIADYLSFRQGVSLFNTLWFGVNQKLKTMKYDIRKLETLSLHRKCEMYAKCT